LDRLVQSHARLRDNKHERLMKLMTGAGFRNVEKTKEGSMLFGLLHFAYYRATV
jgi:hypothetical protein